MEGYRYRVHADGPQARHKDQVCHATVRRRHGVDPECIQELQLMGRTIETYTVETTVACFTFSYS